MNPLDLAQHMEGCLAVLSALGQAGLQISAMTFYEDSMKSVVTAMRNAKIKRLICMTSFYSKCECHSRSSIEPHRTMSMRRSTGKVPVHVQSGHSSDDRSPFGLDVHHGTVPREGMPRSRLHDRPTATSTRRAHDRSVYQPACTIELAADLVLEKEVKVQEDDYFFPDYSTANRIPRANVARCMLDILKDNKYPRQGVAIDMTKG